MKKTARKILCTLLVVIMCFASVSICAFAGSFDGKTYITKEDLKSGYVYFGSYPQSKVTDEDTVAALDAKGETTSAKWRSYGYYSGTSNYGTMEKGNWMRCADVIYNGEKYRGVKFTQYRPYNSYISSSRVNSNQDENGYYINTTYWFKFEPLKWRVLDADKGLILCETLIDAQPFSNTIYSKDGEYYNDALCTIYANDYVTSSIRAWLNNDFYNTAFTNFDKRYITATELNNKSFYTLIGKVTDSPFDSADTKDNIFLLSYAETRNTKYGLSSKSEGQAYGTDYAKCQGLYVSKNSSFKDCSEWLLRSPGMQSHHFCHIYLDGVAYSAFGVASTSVGIRPALTLDLHTHNYTQAITKEPTHMEEGSATYTCVCGDKYESTLPVIEHTFSGSVCTGCGYDKAATCSCNCHKSGIAHFFFVIVNFFEKLFGNNKICACGAAH